MVSAGGQATCLGLVGDDEAADRLGKRLTDAGIDITGVVRDSQRLTTLKTRFVCSTHQVLRVDEETRLGASDASKKAMIDFLDANLAEYDLVILSDYGKGVLSDELIAAAIERAKTHSIPVLVDPKGNDYRKYRGATLVTPNKLEAEQASGMKIDGEESLDRAAQSMGDRCELDAVVITLGKDGIYYRTKDGKRAIRPTEARAVFDVTGAGDTVVALLGLALAGGLELSQAVRLANRGAGIVVGRFGTAAVTRDELLAVIGGAELGKVLDESSLQKALVDLRAGKRRIVFTNGCFDLMHPGHLDYLAKARAYGDVLIVGVNDDASIQRLKGPTRPICPLEDRMTMLAGLEVVDFVVPFGEDTPQDLIERVTPDVLVKGEDWRDKGVVGREWVESHGGQVVLVPLKAGYSTSALVERIRG